MEVLEGAAADDRTLNELSGWLTRCAATAAAHELDYVIPMGTARQLAGLSRAAVLIEAATEVGLVQAIEHDGRPALKLVEDPELWHMIPREERAWNNQRRNDTRRPELIVPVRARDGDACRWCGQTVDWQDRKGGRGGTYDHLQPGKAATVGTLVVCCKSCNSARQDRVDWSRQLLPAPAKPFYKAATVALLRKHGRDVRRTPEVTDQAPPASAGGHLETEDPAPAWAVAGEEQDAGTVGSREVDPASEQDVVSGGLPGRYGLDLHQIGQAPASAEYQRSRPLEDQAPADSGRFRQIQAMTDLDVPGRGGPGRARPGQARPGRGAGPQALAPGDPVREERQEHEPAADQGRTRRRRR